MIFSWHIVLYIMCQLFFKVGELMSMNLVLTYIIIFIILFGLTLPVTYLIVRNIIAIFRFIKELANEDNEAIIEKHQREQLEKKLKISLEKENLGLFWYYKRQIKQYIKKYGFWLYGFLFLVGIVCIYFSYGKSFSGLPTLQLPNLVSVFYLPILIVITFGYYIAKNEKIKWILQLITILYVGMSLLWDIFVLNTLEGLWRIVWLSVALFLFWVHYRNWEEENNKKLFELQTKMQKSALETDNLIQQYQNLLEQRHDNKKHFNMLYHLNEEKEIAAMQEYLAQLERERAQSNEADR